MSTTQTATTNATSNEPRVLHLTGGSGEASSKTRLKAPLKLSGKLDSWAKGFDVTPVIGREYPELQLSQLLEHPDSDDLLTDLAIQISRRNVVFFRNQDIKPEQMLELCDRLHLLAGAPSASTHHIHPITNETSELGVKVYTINSQDYKKRTAGTKMDMLDYKNKWASDLWHSDITWEPVPSDYAMLKVHTIPKDGGGDTMWASAYEAFDRLSKPMQEFLEGLEAEHDGGMFRDFARGLGKQLKTDIERGHPLNIGDALKALHPVVRTNPVTGWKGLFVNQGFTKKIYGLTTRESDMVLEHCFNMFFQNHDLTVRFRWNPNDLAIWDNRSSWHSATQDFNPDDIREGDRVATLGEKPYYDSSSLSRREALALEEDQA